MPRCLLDTGFWYALCDPKDTTRPKETIVELYEDIAFHEIILPWPVAYETLKSEFVNNKIALERFEKEIKEPRVKFLEDTTYRDAAFQNVFDSSLRKKVPRPLSFVDCIVRAIIGDETVRVDCFITFNPGDFHDVCKRRGIELRT